MRIWSVRYAMIFPEAKRGGDRKSGKSSLAAKLDFQTKPCFRKPAPCWPILSCGRKKKLTKLRQSLPELLVRRLSSKPAPSSPPIAWTLRIRFVTGRERMTTAHARETD